jgi:hypothetical protein
MDGIEVIVDDRDTEGGEVPDHGGPPSIHPAQACPTGNMLA